MNSQDIRNLQEAYMEVVENQQLDEAREDEGLTPLQKIRKRNRRDSTLRNIPAGRKTSMRRDMNTLHRGYSKQMMGLSARQMNPKPDGSEMKEQADLYDIILSHLLDEGYAETPEAAEAIMVNMGEEWKEDIVEAETGRGPRLIDAYDKPPYSDDVKDAPKYKPIRRGPKRSGVVKK